MKLSNKVLAIDIGNTTISYAVFQNNRLLANGFSQNGNIPGLLKQINKSGVKSSFNLVISSVVPQKTFILKKSIKHYYKEIKVWEVGKNLRLKVKMKYKSGSLGTDRLVNVYGAIKKYRLPILIIDYGTAITFDYVSRKGVFLGGLIVPGLETSWRALQDRAVLLPKKLVLKRANELAATDTKAAMYSGLLNGFGAMTDGLIDRFKAKYGPLTVLATGGASPLISKYSRGINKVDPLHTLRSLNLIFQREIR